jgi:hypothetical protein
VRQHKSRHHLSLDHPRQMSADPASSTTGNTIESRLTGAQAARALLV